MANILVVTASYLIEHAKKDLPIARELQFRGHDVLHLVMGRAIRPPYPREKVVHDPEFQAAGSIWVDRLKGVIPYLFQCDLLLIPIHKGADVLCAWAHALGKVVVQHDNYGGLDSYYYGADLVAVKGPYFAEFLRKRWNLQEEVVVPTGCVQYDAAVSDSVRDFSRQEFCRIYGLDPRKRIAVWLPYGAFRSDDWSDQKYRRICDIISRSSNHNLIIKPHPTEYAHNYVGRERYGGKRSWEALCPDAPVCRPEHKYVCFNLCDVGISVGSTVSLEFPLFRKPYLYVDVAENPRLKYLREHRDPNDIHPREQDRGSPVPSFVGYTCTSEELPTILEEESYRISDERLYDKHIARFSFRNDGLAYQRVADLVERGCQLAASRRASRRPMSKVEFYLRYWKSLSRWR